MKNSPFLKGAFFLVAQTFKQTFEYTSNIAYTHNNQIDI